MVTTRSLVGRPTGREKLLAEGLFTLRPFTTPDSCCVSRCRRKAGNDRKKVGDCWFCSKHWQQRWRAKNPKQAAFRALKDHAKARRIPFTLTFQFFVELTDAAGYWDQNAASRGEALSIDRIAITGGYTPNNVRVITISENVILGNRERFLSDEVKAILAARRGGVQEFTGVTESSWLDDGDPF